MTSTIVMNASAVPPSVKTATSANGSGADEPSSTARCRLRWRAAPTHSSAMASTA
jgi:hypothetical protein